MGWKSKNEVQTNQYFAPYAIILQQLYFFIILVTISYSFYSKHQKPKTSLPVRTGSGFSIYMYVIYYCDSKISVIAYTSARHQLVVSAHSWWNCGYFLSIRQWDTWVNIEWITNAVGNNTITAQHSEISFAIF